MDPDKLQLKPCPFCGAEVKIDRREVGIRDDGEPIVDFNIRCWNCDLCITGLNFYKTKREIELIWNMRAEP